MTPDRLSRIQTQCALAVALAFAAREASIKRITKGLAGAVLDIMGDAAKAAQRHGIKASKP